MNALGICGYLNGLGKLPPRSVIQAAADGNDWFRIGGITFVDLPPPGVMCTPPRTWVGDTNKRYCLSASWKAARRWTQTVTEEYRMTVVARDMEDAFGVQKTNLAYGVEAVFDTAEWDSSLDRSGPPAGAIDSPESHDWQLDATAAERTGRAAMQEAQECALAYSVSLIRGKARANRVLFEPVYDPTVTLGDTRRVDTPSLTATGKIAAIRERLNVSSGEPEMELALALSRHGGSGLAVDTPLTAPAAPDQPVETNTGRTYYLLTRSGGQVASPPDDESWDGWMTNAYGDALTDPSKVYRERLRIKMPEIEEAARQAVAIQQAVEYEATVPQDEITMRY